MFYLIKLRNNHYLIETSFFCPYLQCNYSHTRRYMTFRYIRAKHDDSDFTRLLDGKTSPIFKTHDGRMIDFRRIYIYINTY